MGNWFTESLDAVGDGFVAVGGAIVDGAEVVGETIVDGAEVVVDVAPDVGGKIVDGVGFVGKAASQGTGALGDGISEATGIDREAIGVVGTIAANVVVPGSTLALDGLESVGDFKDDYDKTGSFGTAASNLASSHDLDSPEGIFKLAAGATVSTMVPGGDIALEVADTFIADSPSPSMASITDALPASVNVAGVINQNSLQAAKKAAHGVIEANTSAPSLEAADTLTEMNSGKAAENVQKIMIKAEAKKRIVKETATEEEKGFFGSLWDKIDTPEAREAARNASKSI